MDARRIFVTQPSLPPLADFLPYLEKIWETKILTNGGPFHAQLEYALCEYLGVEYVSLFTNATIALVTALQVLGVEGEVITTPYSFVATAHSLLWNGLTPVFVDIDPNTLNLDPARISAAITPRTTAILPVHCYGNPCDVLRIQQIADAHGLKVLYDAAHAFGVQTSAGSILTHGNLSVLSFHATKVFNTFEGGAIISRDADTKRRVDNLKNFGFVDEVTVVASGINGKMSELHAAIGLLQLKDVSRAIDKRRTIDQAYRSRLADVAGIRCVAGVSGSTQNYSYFPILVESDYSISRDALYDTLKQSNIFARRYFYPLISDFPMYRCMPSAAPSNLPVAASAAARVICLPIYADLSLEDVQRVVDVIQVA